MELYNESHERIYKYDYKKLLFLLASPCSSCRWTNSIITIIVIGWHWGVYAEQVSKLNTKWLSSLWLLLLAIKKQNTVRCIFETSDEMEYTESGPNLLFDEETVCSMLIYFYRSYCHMYSYGGHYLCPSPAIFQVKPKRVTPRQNLPGA